MYQSSEGHDKEGILVVNGTYYTRTAEMLSVDLTLSPLNTSNAGTYNCTTRVEDQLVELIGTKLVNVTVKGKH